VLQRARAADGLGGLWDAADVQWWWRRPRPTDELPLPVWFDNVGPAAAVGLTAWGSAWQPDAFAVPHVVDIGDVWLSALDLAAAHAPREQLEVLIREDDEVLSGLAVHAGFQATEDSSGLAWMGPDQRPPVSVPSDGFVVVDRSTRPDRPHPMIGRNGDQVEARLRQCSLYDPTLDLSVEAPDGTVAGYALFWLDPATGVGMLEPMRVEDVFQRHGLARALLTAGLDRLAEGRPAPQGRLRQRRRPQPLPRGRLRRDGRSPSLHKATQHQAVSCGDTAANRRSGAVGLQRRGFAAIDPRPVLLGRAVVCARSPRLRHHDLYVGQRESSSSQVASRRTAGQRSRGDQVASRRLDLADAMGE
jgi:GNAT superfamily N-acetyltransferase